MAASKSVRFHNMLLAALPAAEQESLEKQLQRVELPRREQLEQPNKAICEIHFPENGIVSIVAPGAPKGDPVEVGIIGREGMTGLALIHGDDRFPYSSYMQVAGSGYVLPADDLRGLMQRCPEAQRIFLAFAQCFMLQIAETAVANARASIEERLARWLVMAHDRMSGQEIPLTHEFLSLMMGARRPGVTEAMHALVRKGFIESRRGVITVVNRAALVKHAGRYYGVPENEYRRLLKAK